MPETESIILQVQSMMLDIEHNLVELLRGSCQSPRGAFNAMLSDIMYKGKYGIGLMEDYEYANEVYKYLFSILTYTNRLISYKSNGWPDTKGYVAAEERSKLRFKIIDECDYLFHGGVSGVRNQFILDDLEKHYPVNFILTLGISTSSLYKYVKEEKRKEILQTICYDD